MKLKLLYSILWFHNLSNYLLHALQCQHNHYCHCSEISMDCSHLKLKSIIPNMITDLSRHNVDVSYNDNLIDKLTNTSLFTYSKARSLTLRDNLISEIESNAFFQLKDLFSLNLSRNRIRSLHESTFNNMNKLQYLYLSQNELVTLPSHIFQNLNVLKHIRLNDNRLKSLPYNIFLQVPLLQTLYLENNQLSIPHYEWFKTLHFSTDGEVYLDNNPWSCDCRMKNFRKWEIKNHIFKSDPNGDDEFGRITVPRCQFPPGHRAKSIQLLNDIDLECDPPLIIKGNVAVSQHHIEIQAEYGQHTELKCTAEGSPPPEIIFILPNGTEVRPGTIDKIYKYAAPTEHITNTYLTDTELNSVLNITKILPFQSGTYTCVAMGLGYYGDPSNATITFDVHVKGSIWLLFKKILILVGLAAFWIVIYILTKDYRDNFTKEARHRAKYLIGPPNNTIPMNYDPNRDDHEQEEQEINPFLNPEKHENLHLRKTDRNKNLKHPQPLHVIDDLDDNQPGSSSSSPDLIEDFVSDNPKVKKKILTSRDDRKLVQKNSTHDSDNESSDTTALIR